MKPSRFPRERLDDWLLYSFWPCRLMAAAAAAAGVATLPTWRMYGVTAAAVCLLGAPLLAIIADSMQQTVRRSRQLRRRQRQQLRAQMLANPDGNVRLLNLLLHDLASDAAHN